jgi:hypothetical protein
MQIITFNGLNTTRIVYFSLITDCRTPRAMPISSPSNGSSRGRHAAKTNSMGRKARLDDVERALDWSEGKFAELFIAELASITGGIYAWEGGLNVNVSSLFID